MTSTNDVSDLTARLLIAVISDNIADVPFAANCIEYIFRAVWSGNLWLISQFRPQRELSRLHSAAIMVLRSALSFAGIKGCPYFR